MIVIMMMMIANDYTFKIVLANVAFDCSTFFFVVHDHESETNYPIVGFRSSSRELIVKFLIIGQHRFLTRTSYFVTHDHPPHVTFADEEASLTELRNKNAI
jgi:hypothetical protein